MEEYYKFVFILDSKEYYCIWFSGEKDGFVTDGDKLKCFYDFDQLQTFALDNNIEVFDEGSELSINLAQKWDDQKGENVDCKYFLHYWNMMSDLSYSVKESFYGDNKNSTLNKLYDKLFWGSNLPAVTPEGKEYIPIWSKKELDELNKVVKDGLRLINSYLEIKV
ncbi:hypothetical protein [Acetivibrio cellulolyticus]|uniref:hypothetical protein n=1 Tax=Acetivibrio cellulolyticus TaxID=35830 RepID=UPI0001E2D0E7|nr:hypothetical protein [Acetivibrio cellulolyticus]